VIRRLLEAGSIILLETTAVPEARGIRAMAQAKGIDVIGGSIHYAGAGLRARLRRRPLQGRGAARRGRSSMHIHVTAWRRSRHGETSQKVTCATFVFVALDGDGRPRQIPE